MRGMTLGILVLAAMPRVWAEAPPDVPKDADSRFSVGSVNFDEKTQQLQVEGETTLPEGTLLVGTFLRAGNAAGYARATVAKNQKFSFSFEGQGATFFPGKYAVQIDVHAGDQDPAVLQELGGPDVNIPAFKHEVEIGTAEEQKAFAAQAHKKLLEIMHELGRLHGEMYQFASTAIERATFLERSLKGPLPDRDRDRLYKDMVKFSNDDFAPRMRAYSRDFKDYRDQVAGGFLPEVEKDIDMLFVAINDWHAAFWVDVSKALKMPMPEMIAGPPCPRAELDMQIDTIVARINKGLDADNKDEKALWTPVSIMSPENGEIKGNDYESFAAKFRVSLPDDQWKFDFTPMNPTIRLRIIRKVDSEPKEIVGMAIEIRDFPDAKGVEDLNKISEVFNSERWVGFKRLSGKPLEVKDATMPNGIRPGYEMVCLNEDKTANFKIRDYALYCRWLKRTYCVVCMAEVGSFQKYVGDFEKTCKSFMVLDDPVFHDKAQEEIKKAEDAAHGKGGDDRK